LHLPPAPLYLHHPASPEKPSTVTSNLSAGKIADIGNVAGVILHQQESGHHLICASYLLTAEPVVAAIRWRRRRCPLRRSLRELILNFPDKIF